MQNQSSNHGISRSVDRRALAVEAPRFGKGSGAKEDPLQPANYILIFYHIIVKNFLKSQKYADYYFFSLRPSWSFLLSLYHKNKIFKFFFKKNIFFHMGLPRKLAMTHLIHFNYLNRDRRA